jgi:carbon monoxide dehydrogenase subunit G
MLIQQQFTITVRLPEAWAFFRDVPAVATCVPGVEQVDPAGAGIYRGTMLVKVGPIAFRLTGRLVEQEVDEDAHTAVLAVSADDRALGSAVTATLRLRLSEGEVGTVVRLDTEANVLGKLGQFGQGVVKLAADAVMKQFAARAQERLAARSAAGS